MNRFGKPKVQIVVARYNEDVEWLNEFPNVVIYNKGDPLDAMSSLIPIALNLNITFEELIKLIWKNTNTEIDEISCSNASSELETRWIPLPNVGREGHTYYKHIYDNYDTLDDYTIFLQGYPFDHSPNILEDLRKYTKAETLDIEFQYLSVKMVEYTMGVGDLVHYPGLPLAYMYERLFNECRDDLNVVFGGGAQFIVSKERIHARSREFYLTIVKLLEYHVSPIEGHIIERFHPIIFGVEKSI